MRVAAVGSIYWQCVAEVQCCSSTAECWWEVVQGGPAQYCASVQGKHVPSQLLWKPCQHPTNGNRCCTPAPSLCSCSLSLRCCFAAWLIFFPVHTTQSLLVSLPCSFLFQGREGAGEPDLIIPASGTVPLSPLRRNKRLSFSPLLFEHEHFTLLDSLQAPHTAKIETSRCLRQQELPSVF